MLKWSILSLLMLSLLIYVSHPLIFALLLILYSLSIGVCLSFSVTSWYLFSILLVFLGGMMIMVLYLCTLSMGDKIYISALSKFQMLGFMFGSLFLSLTLMFSKIDWNLAESLGNVFKGFSSPILVFLMGYLLLTLFLAVKFSSSLSGALIKFQY